MPRQRTWTEDQLRKATSQCTSTRQLLGILCLKQAGGNYAQVLKYLKEYTIDTSHFKGKGWNKGLSGIGKPRLTLKEILVADNAY